MAQHRVPRDEVGGPRDAQPRLHHSVGAEGFTVANHTSKEEMGPNQKNFWWKTCLTKTSDMMTFPIMNILFNKLNIFD